MAQLTGRIKVETLSRCFMNTLHARSNVCSQLFRLFRKLCGVHKKPAPLHCGKYWKKSHLNGFKELKRLIIFKLFGKRSLERSCGNCFICGCGDLIGTGREFHPKVELNKAGYCKAGTIGFKQIGSHSDIKNTARINVIRDKNLRLGRINGAYIM